MGGFITKARNFINEMVKTIIGMAERYNEKISRVSARWVGT